MGVVVWVVWVVVWGVENVEVGVVWVEVVIRRHLRNMDEIQRSPEATITEPS